MKRFLPAFLMMLAVLYTVSLQAQTIVSTTPSNRNVVLEEFTGVKCPNCPDGHRVANLISEQNPDRIFQVNLHGYTPTIPDYRVPDGTTIIYYFQPTFYPSAQINRQAFTGGEGPQGTVLDRYFWGSKTDSVLAAPSCVNVAAHSVIDFDTRELTVLVEVYYTGNAQQSTNNLTVMLLQNDILGAQDGGSTYNPAQMENGKYIHMHMLRDVISNTGAFGDPISPTTAGSFISKSYTYQIPDSINHVYVDLYNLDILAFVSESQGDITTACKSSIERLDGESINPRIVAGRQVPTNTCNHMVKASIDLHNLGTSSIENLKLEYTLNGNAFTYHVPGTIVPDETATIELPEIYLGIGQSKKLTVKILELNGVPVDPSTRYLKKDINLTKPVGLTNVDSVNVKIWQDRNGSETTWKVFSSDNTVIAEGGPYPNLAQSGTKLREQKVYIPNADCYTFVIYDSYGNGINNWYGAGSYQIITYVGEILASGDGKFEKTDTRMISKYAPGTTVSVSVTPENSTFGSVSGGGNINFGEITMLNATPKAGYQFDSWTINGTIISRNPLFIYQCVENCEIIGNFREINSIPKLNESAVKVFPNPANDVLAVDYSGIIHSYEIYNICGQLVKKETGMENRISVKELSKGVYVLRIHTKDGIKQQRFVKN